MRRILKYKLLPGMTSFPVSVIGSCHGLTDNEVCHVYEVVSE